MKLSVHIKKKLENFTLNIDFESEDQITGLLGASGSGKSMSLKCIAGIERPDEGFISLGDRVLFDSKNHVNIKTQERKVGYLFQNYALFPTKNVKKNVYVGLLGEKDKAKREAKYNEVMEMLQIKRLENKRIFEISGGEQQRVALARMLVSDPDLLLFDEPFSALDTEKRENFQLMLKELVEKTGKMAVLVSHSQDEICRLCGKVCLLSEGKCIRDGDVMEVFSSPLTHEGAVLTGYKNITKAEKRGEGEIYLPNWNVTIFTERKIPDNLKEIAFPFSAFFTGENEISLREVLKDSSGKIIIFSFKGSDELVWWKVKNEDMPALDGLKVGVCAQGAAFLE